MSVSRSNSGMASQQNLMAHPLTVCEHFQNSPPVLQRIMSLMQSHLHATVILAHEEKDYANSCTAHINNIIIRLYKTSSLVHGREPLYSRKGYVAGESTDITIASQILPPPHLVSSTGPSGRQRRGVDFEQVPPTPRAPQRLQQNRKPSSFFFRCS